MSSIYMMDGESRTTPMKRIRCKNEDEELQQLLKLNPNLLPGDQIDRKCRGAGF
jgi:hypothetical protein